jgi:predicted phosphodiesterase
MKLHVVSDLHLGFRDFDLPETDADVLVLAGDVDVGLRGIERAKAWARGRPVLYVAGNHEFYGESVPRHVQKMRDAAAGSDVRFLEEEAVVLGGVRFLGCTLWTGFDLFGTRNVAAAEAQAGMNDYRQIRVDPEYRRLRPTDTMAWHARSLRWLVERLEERFDGPTVVITHAAPSLDSVAPIYRRETLTAAFASDLRALLDGRAALWIHGHTHFCCDYTVGGTRVIANQRGYPHEDTGGFDPAFTVEVPGH